MSFEVSKFYGQLLERLSLCLASIRTLDAPQKTLKRI